MPPHPPLPAWPAVPPAHGRVLLREVRESDVPLARELATDPYVPLTGTLPAHATDAQALAWVHRQRGRHREGAGFSFTIVDAATETPVGHCGLWLRQLADGRGSAGYAVAASEINALGLKSIVSGTITTCLMGAIVGVLN